MLYVMPDWQEQGLGRGLLCGSLQLMAKNGCSSALVWVLADNPARFFYEAMEGKRVGEKDEAIWGVTLHQIAYGWRSLSPLPTACRGSPPMKHPPTPACPPPNLLQSIPLRERRPASR